jgi:hypothetical protein
MSKIPVEHLVAEAAEMARGEPFTTTTQHEMRSVRSS